MEKGSIRQIHREVQANTDDLFQAAVRFGDSHQPLSTSQSNGLFNLLNAENNINTILSVYIQGQSAKSTVKDPEFWKDLRRELDGLKKIAEEIQQKVGPATEGKKAQQNQRNDIHLLLAQDFIQHLVAHMLYKTSSTNRR